MCISQALLDGELALIKGTIDLPLLPDYINRPMQMVHERGKQAITNYEVIEVKDNMTRVHFYPITVSLTCYCCCLITIVLLIHFFLPKGRTHQLRTHAAHFQGLDCPIVGDDIYGQRANRLCLHADLLQLTHPVTEKRMTFTSNSPF